MNQHDAISQIAQVREQLARAEAFWVYRVASVAFTGVLAFVAVIIQSQWGLNSADQFLLLWVSTALVCGLVIGVEMTIRCRWSGSALLCDAAIVAARQFTPCVVAGGLLTLVLRRSAPEAVGLLPGLWAILFSLGIFASRPGLPRAIHFAGIYYLLAGLVVLVFADNREAFNLWPMPFCFGAGQLLTAAILYFSAERLNASKK
jgi:hypothetical protein